MELFKDNVMHGLSCLPLILGGLDQKSAKPPWLTYVALIPLSLQTHTKLGSINMVLYNFRFEAGSVVEILKCSHLSLNCTLLWGCLCFLPWNSTFREFSPNIVAGHQYSQSHAIHSVELKCVTPDVDLMNDARGNFICRCMTPLTDFK